MSCFGSKHELLQVADHVIAHYYQRVPFVRNHPQAIDLDMLVMELMNYPSFKKMARQLGVQRQLLANRMKYLHILTSDVPYRHTLSLMEAG